MFRTALISLDYSAAQGPLLDCLADLRDMGVTRVILTHVVQVGYGQGAAYGNKEALEDWLRGRATPLREAGLGVEIDIRAAGEVAKDILAAASEHGAALIVIGSRGQNMIRGLFLGSVACEEIRLSPLPVRLEWIEATGKDGDAACERSCHAGLRRVLLATDFSPQAQAAEAAAAKLAPHAGAVDLVHVVSPDEATRYARWPVMARAPSTTSPMRLPPLAARPRLIWPKASRRRKSPGWRPRAMPISSSSASTGRTGWKACPSAPLRPIFAKSRAAPC